MLSPWGKELDPSTVYIPCPPGCLGTLRIFSSEGPKHTSRPLIHVSPLKDFCLATHTQSNFSVGPILIVNYCGQRDRVGHKCHCSVHMTSSIGMTLSLMVGVGQRVDRQALCQRAGCGMLFLCYQVLQLKSKNPKFKFKLYYLMIMKCVLKRQYTFP